MNSFILAKSQSLEEVGHEKDNGRNEYDPNEDASWRRDTSRRHDPDPSFAQPNSYASGGGYVPPNNYDTSYRGRGSSNYSKRSHKCVKLGHFFFRRPRSWGDV